VFSDVGAAVLALQTGLTPDRLIADVCFLLRDAARRFEMCEAARSLDHPNAAERVVDEIMALAA